jgi:hypothetical protein
VALKPWALKAHKQLIRLHGEGPPNASCGMCKHLHRYRRSGRWSKCNLTQWTNSEATDWSTLASACGKYQRDTDGDS